MVYNRADAARRQLKIIQAKFPSITSNTFPVIIPFSNGIFNATKMISSLLHAKTRPMFMDGGLMCLRERAQTLLQIVNQCFGLLGPLTLGLDDLLRRL
jgi:hypothetical protein